MKAVSLTCKHKIILTVWYAVKINELINRIAQCLKPILVPNHKTGCNRVNITLHQHFLWSRPALMENRNSNSWIVSRDQTWTSGTGGKFKTVLAMIEFWRVERSCSSNISNFKVTDMPSLKVLNFNFHVKSSQSNADIKAEKYHSERGMA